MTARKQPPQFILTQRAQQRLGCRAGVVGEAFRGTWTLSAHKLSMELISALLLAVFCQHKGDNELYHDMLHARAPCKHAAQKTWLQMNKEIYRSMGIVSDHHGPRGQPVLTSEPATSAG